jgi:hypothetical protein
VHSRDVEWAYWTANTAAKWEKIYPAVSEGLPSLLGAISSRAEAQVVRLALLYALLDLELRPSEPKVTMGLHHLNAALAVWSYCEYSARHIFGELLGDPIADEILRALR